MIEIISIAFALLLQQMQMLPWECLRRASSCVH